jgi:hypothetical protein
MAARRTATRKPVIVTASLITGVAGVTHGMLDSVRLIEEIVRMGHVEWELDSGVKERNCMMTRPGKRRRITGEQCQMLGEKLAARHMQGLCPAAVSERDRLLRGLLRGFIQWLLLAYGRCRWSAAGGGWRGERW